MLAFTRRVFEGLRKVIFVWDIYGLKTEKEIQEFWKKNKILEKSRKKNSKGKPFYLMDGPPFPNGHIHLGTALNKSLKDAVMRFKRMQGFDVFDTAGWDCHGLPTELKVEKKLGLKGREEIEGKIGVEKFINECNAFSTEFIGKMTQEFENLGVWMDFENSYKTLDNEYIESVWWSFKQASDKGLLYKGVYPIQACPECETPLAFNEIEHEKLTDTSVYVKFELAEKPGTFLVIWTTTPWTLPGNTGVMAHPEFEYVECQLSNGEKWILARDLAQKIFDITETGFTVLKTFKGKELEGLKYRNPLEKFLNIKWEGKENSENRHKVILSARYVNLDDGTGLVHCAPGHGREDFDAGKKASLPLLSPVKINGLLTEETGKYAGKKAKKVDAEIIEDLKAENALVFQHSYSHEYPVCWRCNSPLLMISIPQWFFKTESLKGKAKELNEKVIWIPKWAKERFKNWLDEGVADWPVTRDRYWGTPAPIWECGNCGSIKVIESMAELEKNSTKKLPKSLNLHRPWIDAVKLKCEKCKNEMQRVPEILDGWFDSGVSSWAALKYPKDKKLFEKYWPSDLNIEGRDQIRGWWNSELMCSMMAFDKAPFKSIGMHGFFLDLEKKKMAKSKGNTVSPEELIEKNSRDAVRYYMVQLLNGEDIAFNPEVFRDIAKTFSILQNSFNYIQMYMKPQMIEKLSEKELKEMQAEDIWIISRTNSLLNEVIESLEDCNFGKATNALDCFITEDFSRTYIKLIRERIGGKSQATVEKTMNYCITQLLKAMAPITPHLAEFYYQKLQGRKEESIHLLSLEAGSKELIDKKLEEEIAKTKQIAEAMLALREENKLKLRWALKEAILQTKTGQEFDKTKELIARMSNVQKVSEQTLVPLGKEFAKKEAGGIASIFLNIKAGSELKEQWELAELLRRIQEARKQAKLTPKEKANVLIEISRPEFLQKFKAQIEKETNIELKEAKIPKEKERLVEIEFALEVKK